MSNILITNRINEAIKQAGRSVEYVRQRYEYVSGCVMSDGVFYQIRSNKRQISVSELIIIARILEIQDYRDLILEENH